MDAKEFDAYKHKMYADIYPKSTKQLKEFIDKILRQKFTKKTNSEIIASVMILTSNFMRRQMGDKGWEGEEADKLYMMIRNDSRMGLMVCDAMDMFYPQFDKRILEWIVSTATTTEFKEEALYLLKNYKGVNAITKRRWNQIASQDNTMSEIERKKQMDIDKYNDEIYSTIRKDKIIDGEFIIQ